MIELKIKTYCHDCDSFEPKVEDCSDDWYINEFGLPVTGSRVILCRYHKRCANMVRYLERKMKNNEHS